jgi:hypothetical protein
MAEKNESRVDHYHHEKPEMSVSFEVTKYSKGGFGYTVKVNDAPDSEAAQKKLFEITQILDRDYPSGG